MKCERILSQNNIYTANGKAVIFPGWDAFLNAAKDDSKMPEIIVQLSDGAGGWINGMGPYTNHEKPDFISMISFAAWPRSSAELEFRAARPGLQPLTWKMRNPSFVRKSSLP